MSLQSDALSWFWSNQFLLLFIIAAWLGEAANTSFIVIAPNASVLPEYETRDLPL
jgi:hypothetical protein